MIITIHGSSITVRLPYQPDFIPAPKRQESELIALDGSIIRQVSALKMSSARPKYSGTIRESDAHQLITMHDASASVVIAPGDGRAYTATINNLVAPVVSTTGTRRVAVSFDCALLERIA